MNVVDLPLAELLEAPWNPNRMDAAMLARLKESLARFGVVSNLVVRPLPAGGYEVLSGNQRLQALRELGSELAPCLVVELGDARARLLAQALNQIQGQDDLGLKAAALRALLAQLPPAEILSVLPESARSLADLATLGQADLAAHLRNWQQAQAARLKHLTIQLTAAQQAVVERALARAAASKDPDPANPNPRGAALFWLCQRFLDQQEAPP